ncbi:hypothetical protein FRB98_008952 [Tulasnella sp. 332]|nr:hypothetical protein FRB98_008952 [Tulasnella sp. 332]
MKFNQTLTSSSPLLALGSLLFNGTGIWLSGSQTQPSNAPYSVVLDSETSTFTTYPSSGALFTQFGLSSTEEHSVDINPSSILSSAIIEVDADANTSTRIDDSQLFAFTPSDSAITVQGDWIANQCLDNEQNVYAGTCHTSHTSGDSFSYTFEGDAIVVYGALENTQAGYTVSVDGSSPTTYTGNAASESSTSSVVLALASNLGSGKHVITITNKPTDGVSKLEIDYVNVWGNMSSNKSSSGGISKAAKIGLCVGAVLGCVLIALAVLIVLLHQEKTNAVKAAAAKLRSSDTWSFGWMKNETEKDADTRSVASTVVEYEKTLGGTPTGVSFPVLSRAPRAAPPTHTKMTSFDQPWLENGPRLSSIHPLDSDSSSPPSRFSRFFFKWRR